MGKDIFTLPAKSKRTSTTKDVCFGLIVYMILSVYSFSVSAQDTAETALAMKEGNNDYTFASASSINTVYYKYTTSADQSQLVYVTLSEQGTSIICSSDGTTDNTIQGCILSEGLLRIFPVEANQTVYFIFTTTESNISFDTEFHDYDLSLGNTCEEPVIATEEDFFVKTTGSGYYPGNTYVGYSCTEDGVLEMTFSNYASVRIQEGCSGTPSTVTTSYDGTTRNYKGKTPVKAGTDYIVIVETSSPLVASFKQIEMEIGKSCDLPFDVTEGDCTLPKEAATYWYRIQPEKSGFMYINSNSPLYGGSINIYTSCESYSKIAGIAGYFQLRCHVDAGSTYLISIESIEEFEENITFSIAVKDPEAGESIDNPIDITNETEVYTPQYDGTYYYSVMIDGEEPKFLVIDATEAGIMNSGTNVSITRQDNPYTVIANGTDYLKAAVSPGINYIVKWNIAESNATPLRFEVSYEDVAKGDICENPIEAVSGENKLTACETKYFSYLPTRKGWMIISAQEPLNVSFPRDCNPNSGEYPKTTVGLTYKIEVTPDKEYIIKFSNVEYDTTFNLTEEDYKDGESCDMPLEIVLGENNLSSTIPSCWYSFVAPQDGKLTVSSDMIFESGTSGTSSIVVYTDGCESYGTNISSAGEEGVVFEGSFVVSQNDVIIINVNQITLNQDKTLTISIRDLEPGEACDKPINIEQEGDFELAKASRQSPVWYSIYLMPGNFCISSTEYFSMSMYESCESSSPLAVSNYNYDYETYTGDYRLNYTVENEGMYILKLEDSYSNITANITGNIKSDIRTDIKKDTYVFVSDGKICVNSSRPEKIQIYSITGELRITTEETYQASFEQPDGLYLVKVGNSVHKVFVR